MAPLSVVPDRDAVDQLAEGIRRPVHHIEPVTPLCRSNCSFKRPCAQKPRGVSKPVLSDGVVDCKSY
jgi:hypothetical protein